MHLGSNSLWRYIKQQCPFLMLLEQQQQTNKQLNITIVTRRSIPTSPGVGHSCSFPIYTNSKRLHLMICSFRLSSIGVPQTFLQLWLTAVTTEPAVTMWATLFIIFTLTVIIKNHIICTPSCTFPAAVYCPVLTG